MQKIQAQFPAMASLCDITVIAEDEAIAKYAIEQAADEIRRIEAKYSRYRKDSIISQINHAAGQHQHTPLDDETCWLLNHAARLYQLSDGLFDITSGILSSCWDFEKKQVPDQKTIDSLLRLVGWSKIDYSQIKQEIYLPEQGMSLDFGGFGKEYAVDRAYELMYHHGIRHGFINFGGDIRVFGPQPDNTAWKIGIRHPAQSDGLIATIPMRSGGLATSGDYERYFELNGKSYTHIIHPKTGYPAHYWRSVSVVAETTLEAGSYSTIGMLMQHPQTFFDSLDIKYLLINPEGNITIR